MGRRKKKKRITIKSPETRAIAGITIVILGAAAAIAPFSSGGTLLDILLQYLGTSSLLWGIAISVFGVGLLTQWEYFINPITRLGYFLLAITGSTFFSFWIPDGATDYSEYGGSLGNSVHTAIVSATGRFVEFLILLVLIVVSFSLVSQTSIDTTIENFTNFFAKIGSLFRRRKVDVVTGDGEMDSMEITAADTEGHDDEQEEQLGPEMEFNDSSENSGENYNPITDEVGESEDTQSSVSQPPGDNIEFSQEEKDGTGILTQPKYMNWKFPPIELLQEPVSVTPDQEVHKRNAVMIERTLRSFGVDAKINKVTIGPTVVQYALKITEGVKVSGVKKLSNDIALALATPENQIRIEAPIPGTSLIGIEMPNPSPNFVYIRDIISEVKRDHAKYQLPLALGKNVKGERVVQDLAKMPHLLVAGATGTGKSVGINSILTGLLMSKTPDELKLIMVDPKMVELAPYNGIPHLLTPVITDMELVVNALQWAVEEMNTRYRLLKQTGARNLQEYNKKTGGSVVMPYIVVVIDEMADLILSTGADVETNIVKLTQKARAIGIHLILATQRPSREVITGLIKANVPGRIAYSVATQIDSRVIMDINGAETLIGKGDMLFKSPSSQSAMRLQGAWTDTPDTEAVVDFIKKQTEDEEEEYLETITKPIAAAGGGGAGGAGGFSEDELFSDALDIVINGQKASASMLQRRLRIGYNRAARLIEDLEAAGAISGQDGSSARKVLITSPDQLGAKSDVNEIDE